MLSGAPNAGKSSLINALLGYQRAIVWPEPGTTRDVLTATTAIEGWPIDLIDTAEGPVVIDINPRLTTSYVGLRRAIAANPAALVLKLLTHRLEALGSANQMTRQPVRVDAHAA